MTQLAAVLQFATVLTLVAPGRVTAGQVSCKYGRYASSTAVVESPYNDANSTLWHGFDPSSMRRFGEVNGSSSTLAVGLLGGQSHYFAVGSQQAPTSNIAECYLPNPSGHMHGSILDPSNSTYPRNGEGSMVALSGPLGLSTGSILFFYAKQTQSYDVGKSSVFLRRSSDGGSTWMSPVEFAASNGSSRGLISTARASNGTLVVAYMLGESKSAAVKVFRTSTDGGKSWSVERPLSDGIRPYMSGAMDRMRRLSSGRILIPIHAKLPLPSDGTFGVAGATKQLLGTYVYHSPPASNGMQFLRATKDPITVPSNPFNNPDAGFWEAALAEWAPGHVIMVARTATGRLWASFSEDDGLSWTVAMPTDIRNPLCPPQLYALRPVDGWSGNAPTGPSTTSATSATGWPVVLLNDPHTNTSAEGPEAWAMGQRLILGMRTLSSDSMRVAEQTALSYTRQVIKGSNSMLSSIDLDPPEVKLAWQASSYRTIEYDGNNWYSYPSVIRVAKLKHGFGHLSDGGESSPQPRAAGPSAGSNASSLLLSYYASPGGPAARSLVIQNVPVEKDPLPSPW